MGKADLRQRRLTQEVSSMPMLICIILNVCVMDVFCADPQEERRTEIMKLKRRFLKDRKITSAFFAKTGSRKKIMREVSFVCVWVYLQ